MFKRLARALSSRFMNPHESSDGRWSLRRTAVLEQLEDRLAPANSLSIVTGGAINTAAALLQAQRAGDFLFGNTGTFTVDPAAFVGAGAITLQANNDVTVSNAITDSNAGDSLAIQAGRSIIDNANITYATALNFTANSQLAAVGAGTMGTAAFTMGAGTAILSSASINLKLDSGIGRNATGNVSITTLMAPVVSVANNGPTAGSSILNPAGGDIISPNVTLATLDGSIGASVTPLNLSNSTVTAQAAAGIFLFGGSNLTLGTITNNSGAISISAVGSIAVNGTITDNDSSSNGAVTLHSGDNASSGPANVTFGARAAVNAANQGYLAGVGATTTSTVVFTPGKFQGSGGASSNVQSFTFQQDASINDSEPALAQFTSGVLPTTYTIESQNGNVTLLTNANIANTNLVVTSANGSVTFGSTSVNSSLSLTSLEVFAVFGTIFLNNNGAYTLGTTGTVSGSTAGQIYTGAVSLAQDTTLISNNGGGVNFASGSASNNVGSATLTVQATGAITIGGGFNSGTGTCTFTGALINLNGSMFVNNQTYNGPVLLGASVVIIDATTTFNSTIDSAPGTSFGLTVDTNAPGVIYAGNIGVNNPLDSLTVGRNLPAIFNGATVVDTVNGQSYTGNVTVNNDLVLNSSSGSITFGNLLDSGATPASLTVNAATSAIFGQILGSAVGSVHPFSQLLVIAPSISLNGNVTTTGDQLYNGAVTLANIVTVNTALGSVVNFNGAIDGAQAGTESLTIGNTNVAGEVIFGGNIGATNPLAPLNVSATRIFMNGTSVITVGAQMYSGDVFLGGTSPITLNTSAAGNPVTFNKDLTLGASAGAATDTVNVTGIFTLTANSTLYSTLNTLSSSAFGNVRATTSNLANANLSLTFLGTPTVGGGNSYTIATTVAGTTFANVTIGGVTKFYVSGVDFTALNASGLTLTPVNPTNAPHTVGSSGTFSTIQAAINASVSGDVIEIDTTLNNYAGFTTFNGSQNVSLLFDFMNGGTVLINSAVTLTKDTAFGLSGTGLTFTGSAATVDGGVNLTVFATSGQNLDLQGNVGGTTPLHSLTTVGSNVTVQLAANITTNASFGGQVFNGNVQLQTSLPGHLGALTAKTVTFNGAVNDGVAGGGEDTLSVVGNAVFAGASTSLGGLTVSGATFLNNGGITTKSKTGFGAGNQIYSGAVILGSALTTLSTGGPTAGSLTATSFLGTGVNTNSLTLGTFSGVTVNGGELSAVSALTVTSAVNLTGDIATGGMQTYASAVTLSGDTTLTTTQATFGSTVDGGHNLFISGPATFSLSVGSGTNLTSLTVTQAATFQDTTGVMTITTTGSQTYLGAVSNTGVNDLDFTAGAGGVVRLLSTFNGGGHNSTITGVATLAGNVVNVASFLLTGGQVTIENNAASISATSTVNFFGGILLANVNGGTLTLNVGNAVTLATITGGGNNLTINATNGNTITLGGNIGGVNTLVVNNNASNNFIVINATAITTSGTQTYNALQLGPSVNLTGTMVTFSGAIGSGFGLTITGNAVINGSMGSLTTVMVTGTTTVNNPGGAVVISFDSTGNQTYQNTFTINTAALLSLSGAPTVTFGGPILGNGNDLNVQNAVVFDGVVNGVGNLTMNGGTVAINGGIVSSTGTQDYGTGTVTLSQSSSAMTILMAAGAASSINFGGPLTVSGTSTSLSALADDSISFGGAVALGASGALHAVADMTGLNAAGSGNGEIFISGAISTNGGFVLLAGSAFNDSAAINVGGTTGAIDLAPSVQATVGVGAGAANFQVSNAQLAGFTAALLAIGGVDATSVTVNGANATASGVTGPVYLISGPANTNGSPVGEIDFTMAASQFDATANMALVCATNGAVAIAANVSASNQITLYTGISGISEAAGLGLTGAALLAVDTSNTATDTIILSGTNNIAFTAGTPNFAASGPSLISFTNSAGIDVGSLTNFALAPINPAVSGVVSTAGNVTLNATGAEILSAAVSAGSASTITLNPTSGVNQTAGALAAASLLLTGSGPFTLNQPGNHVTTIAANLAGSITYQDVGTFAIGTVGSTNGITTANNSLTLTVGGSLMIVQSLNVGAGNAITINVGTATVATTPVSVTLGNSAQVTAGSTSITARSLANDSDTFQAPDLSNTWAVTGAGAGTLSNSNFSNPITFSLFENLNGGAGNDSFTLSAGSLAGALNGGGGTNTLTANNIANTWNITSRNGGTVTGVGSFSNIENLVGGSNTDNFVFGNGMGVTGTVNGGAGTNTLDYSAYTSPVAVNFAGATATGTGGISNIEDAIQAAVNLLVTAPASVTAGQAFTLMVTARDSFNNTVTGGKYQGQITFTGTDGAAMLPGNYTFTAADGGVHAFSAGATLNTSGNQTIKATDTAIASLSGTTGLAVALSGANITGTVFLDLNASGQLDSGEPGLPGRIVYIDLNHSGTFRTGDPSAVTDTSGHFVLSNLSPGNLTLRLQIYPGDSPTQPPEAATQITLVGAVNQVVNFAIQKDNPLILVQPTPQPYGTNNPDLQTAQINAYYQLILARTGSRAEVNAWRNQWSAGLTLQQVASTFYHSSEFYTNQVDRLYATYFHRQGEAAGVNYWVSVLEAGVSISEIAVGFLTSAEFNADHTDNTDFVQNLYQDVLGRTAESGGLAAWLAALQQGTTRNAVVRDFVFSTEAYELAVSGFYQGFLHRWADPQGEAYWLSQLESNGRSLTEVALGFLLSQETQTRAAATVTGSGF